MDIRLKALVYSVVVFLMVFIDGYGTYLLVNNTECGVNCEVNGLVRYIMVNYGTEAAMWFRLFTGVLAVVGFLTVLWMISDERYAKYKWMLDATFVLYLAITLPVALWILYQVIVLL